MCILFALGRAAINQAIIFYFVIIFISSSRYKFAVYFSFRIVHANSLFYFPLLFLRLLCRFIVRWFQCLTINYSFWLYTLLISVSFLLDSVGFSCTCWLRWTVTTRQVKCCLLAAFSLIHLLPKSRSQPSGSGRARTKTTNYAWENRI